MKITETKTFNLNPNLKDVVSITFINRKGGTDNVHFTKFYDVEVKTKAQTYQAGITHRTYAVNSDKTTVYNSKHLTEKEFNWLQDLMISPMVTVNGKPVRVLDSSYKYNNVDRLWTIELEVQNIYAQNKIIL